MRLGAEMWGSEGRRARDSQRYRTKGTLDLTLSLSAFVSLDL